MDARIEASAAAKTSRSENTQRNVKQADRAFCKFLHQAQACPDKCSALLRNLCNEDNDAAQEAKAMSSTGALFMFLLENKRDADLVQILQEYALKRSDSIKYKSLLTEMRSLKTHVVDVVLVVSVCSATAEDEKKRELNERINDIFAHEHLKNTRNYIMREQVRGGVTATSTDSIDNSEDNSIENDAPLDAAAEDINSNRSKNDPGKNYCAAFTWKQTVQVAEHLFATAQVFWLALTNLLRGLGRPSSLHTMNFDRTMQSSFDLLAKQLWRVRTEYSKNHNVPQCFAVAMDMTNPILCPLVGVAIALAHIKPCFAIDKARDTLLGVLYASTRTTNSGAQPKNGPKTLPSDRTLREQFKAHVVNSLAPSTSSSNNHQYLSLYSYHKFMVTHLVNAFHCNELHAKARAGWVEFQRQATAHATGSTTAASWVSSVDVSTHYVSLESAGDERMALILSGRHPDAPYRNYLLDRLVCNCPAEVVQMLAEAVFPANVRACFSDGDKASSSSSSSLQRVLVYALLIAKAKIRPAMLASFAQHNGLFERDCFEQPVVQKLLCKLRKIPLYPYAEPNTTYLSYLQQGRFAHYEVNRETGSLEAIEFVKQPVRVVCGSFKQEEEEEDEDVDEEAKCGGESVDGASGVKKKLSKKPIQTRAGEDIDALATRVIDLALDSSEEEEDIEEAEAGNADEGLDSRHGSCLEEESPVDNNNSNSNSHTNSPRSFDVVEVEAAFAARLGYDRATNTVHLSDVTDAFMSTVLVALQRHYNTRGPLRELLHTIFRHWEKRVSDEIPALQLWPEAGMHALKRASLASKNKVASRLHYAYISRRDIVKVCVRPFITVDKAAAAFEAAKCRSLKEVKAYCKGL